MKKKALLIAEKPDFMKKVKAVYDKFGHEDEITFMSFAGHVVRLQEPGEYKKEWEGWTLEQLPMIPDKFKYLPDKSKMNYYTRVKQELESGKYDYVINGCDPAREGNNIFTNATTCMGSSLPTKRLWHHDETEGELKRALNNLVDGNEPWVVSMNHAGELRGYFDWSTGMNFTRAVSLKANKKINLGRVMTPTLRMVVDRELEIRNFEAKDFWEIECDFGKYQGIHIFKDEDGNEATRIFDKFKAEDIKSKLGPVGIIESVKDEQVVKYAPELHSLATLQNEANKVYGYTMSETLAIAQSLYEKQCISYPRTDSSHLTTAISNEFDKILKTIEAIPELTMDVQNVLNIPGRLEDVAKKKKYVDDKKVSDHYAIIVTKEVPDLNSLTEQERHVYMLIAKRVLAIFMNPMVSNKTTIITDNEGYKFKTIGKVLVDLGYRGLYKYEFDSGVIPACVEGDRVNNIGVELIEKKTSPPKRLDDASLNDLMQNAGKFIEDKELKEVMKEAKGIGTPATRAQIVEKLVTLKMVERRKKSFYATEYGLSIIDQLKDFDITSVEMTAVWEQKLAQIEACEYSPDDFYDEMISYVEKMTAELKQLDIRVNTDKKVLGVCPSCGSPVIEGNKYYLCSKYTNEKNSGCSFIIGKTMWNAKITTQDAIKILEGKPTKEFSFKIEKDGEIKQWKSALIYSKEEGRLTFHRAERTRLTECPSCKGNIIEGSEYYLCENYKKCCSVILPKKYLGATITKSDAIALLEGGETKEKKLKVKKDGEIKQWSTKLKYDSKENKFIFPKQERSIVAKCKCGSNVIEGKDYYLCENYKKTCDIILPKVSSGYNITKKDVVDLLDGKVLEDRLFTWKSGKQGKAGMKYTNRIEYIFKDIKK